MTSRRVNVTLTAATDEDAHQVMAGVLDAVRNALPGLAIDYVTNSVFDVDEDDKPETLVQLVVDPVAGILSTWVDNPDRAEEFARNVDGVVVELPVVADYRAEEA